MAFLGLCLDRECKLQYTFPQNNTNRRALGRAAEIPINNTQLERNLLKYTIK